MDQFADIGDVEFVTFDESDTDELVTMWRASFEAGVGIVDPHPLSEQRCYLLETVVPNNDVRVAVLPGQKRKIVGFIAATRESVAQLYVRVGYHHQGLGTKLLDWAKTQSGGSLWLYTFEQNRNARQFYESRGFTVEERGFEPMWNLADIKYVWSARDRDDIGS